ncbi:MAG: DMT family transporter [Clostridia bacterium]|nr:DMT family transporter [Clostridia bacterium]
MLLILPVIWGSYYVASHSALAYMSTFSVGVAIRGLTLVLLTAIMACRKELGSLVRLKHIWKWLLAIGLMGFLLDTTAFIGLKLSPAGIGTALLKCDVLFVNLISAWLYHERFTKTDWALTLVMLFGVFLVLGIDFRHLELFNPGNIFFILSALFVSVNAFLIKKVQHHPVNPGSDMVIAYYNNLVTMILFLTVAFPMGQMAEFSRIAGNKSLTVALLLSGLGQTLIYVVYYHNLRRNPVWLVKVILLLMPVFSAFLGFVLFRETMTAVQLIGVAVVLAGAMAMLILTHKRDAAKQTAPAEQ